MNTWWSRLTKLLLLRDVGLIDGDIDMPTELKKNYFHVYLLYKLCVSICTCAYVLMLASRVSETIYPSWSGEDIFDSLSWLQSLSDVNGVLVKASMDTPPKIFMHLRHPCTMIDCLSCQIDGHRNRETLLYPLFTFEEAKLDLIGIISEMCSLFVFLL